MEVKKFYEFLEEDLNYTTSSLGGIEFEDRWFYYEPDDEIIYGCDESPANDTKNVFYFNPRQCVVGMGGEQQQYDVNDPICLITCSMSDNEIKVYTTDVFEYLETLGYDSGKNIEDKHNIQEIQSLFDGDDDYRFLLIYGNKLIATTFDIIEEN